MKSKFIFNLQDMFDSHLDMDGVEAFANFFPAADYTGFHFASLPPPVILLVPTVPAETVEARSAQNGSGGAGSVVSETSATGTGMTINLEFDAAAMASTAAAARRQQRSCVDQQ
jgi:hypothetical protein